MPESSGLRRSVYQLSRFLLIFIGVTVASVCQVNAEQPVRSITVELDGPTDLSMAGAVVAKRTGLFAGEGLDVRIRSSFDADRPFVREDSTTVRISIVDASYLLQQRGKGIPLVAFAAGYIDSTVLLYFRSNRGIRGPGDIESKSIQYDASRDTGLIFEWFLSKNPIARSRIIEVSGGLGVNALIDHKIDVLLGHAGVESRSLAESRIPFGTLDPRQYGVHTLGTVYVAEETTIRKQPEVLIRFLKALIGGWELVYGDFNASVPIIEAELAGLYGSQSSIRVALEEQRVYLRPGATRFGEFPRHRWVELHNFMLQRRRIKAPLNLSDAINYELVSEAYRRLR